MGAASPIFVPWIGGGSDGAERQEAEADRTEDAGRNPGGRPLNTKEPKPEKKAPRCPSWLEDEAKKEWKRMAKVLENMGLLTEMDMAAFAGYCQAYARWKEAEEFLTQHGRWCGRPMAICSRCRRYPLPRPI